MTTELPKTKKALFALLRKTTDEAERTRIRLAIGQLNSAAYDAELNKSEFAKHLDHVAKENERTERSARYYDRKLMRAR